MQEDTKTISDKSGLEVLIKLILIFIILIAYALQYENLRKLLLTSVFPSYSWMTTAYDCCTIAIYMCMVFLYPLYLLDRYSTDAEEFIRGCLLWFALLGIGGIYTFFKKEIDLDTKELPSDIAKYVNNKNEIADQIIKQRAAEILAYKRKQVITLTTDIVTQLININDNDVEQNVEKLLRYMDTDQLKRSINSLLKKYDFVNEQIIQISELRIGQPNEAYKDTNYILGPTDVYGNLQLTVKDKAGKTLVKNIRFIAEYSVSSKPRFKKIDFS